MAMKLVIAFGVALVGAFIVTAWVGQRKRYPLAPVPDLEYPMPR